MSRENIKKIKLNRLLIKSLGYLNEYQENMNIVFPKLEIQIFDVMDSLFLFSNF